MAAKLCLFLGMLLELENTNQANLKKLMDYARQLNLQLRLIDDSPSSALPGKPLSPEALAALIEKSRRSGTISLKEAHSNLRNSFNGD